MASLDFGEICEPSSRAFWDDFDCGQDNENFLTTPSSNLNSKWNWETEDGSPPSNLEDTELFVLEGCGMTEFLKRTLIKTQKPIGKHESKNVAMYYFPTTKQVILISKENDLNLSALMINDFVSIILKAKNVVTFSLQSKINFKGMNAEIEKNLVFIQAINSKIRKIEEIKAPNFITGIAAGVSTIRFLNDKTYSCYIGYVDPLNELDALAAQPIIKLLQELNIKCDDTYIPKYKDPSHLYM